MDIAVYRRSSRTGMELLGASVKLRRLEDNVYEARLCGGDATLCVAYDLVRKHLLIRYEDCPNIGEYSTPSVSPVAWFYSIEGSSKSPYTVHRCVLCGATISAYGSDGWNQPRKHQESVRLSDDSITSTTLTSGLGYVRGRLVSSDEPGTIIAVLGTRFWKPTVRFVSEAFPSARRQGIALGPSGVHVLIDPANVAQSVLS